MWTAVELQPVNLVLQYQISYGQLPTASNSQNQTTQHMSQLPAKVMITKNQSTQNHLIKIPTLSEPTI